MTDQASAQSKPGPLPPTYFLACWLGGVGLHYVLPLAHPYCDVSRPDGTFRLGSLPLGPSELQLLNERTGYLETPKWKKGRVKITISPGKNDLGTIRLTPSAFPKP